MNVYDMPCPVCGAKIVSTAKMPDDTAAPTYCAEGHKFMRSEAFASHKASVAKFYHDLRADLGQAPVKINATRRLKASLEDRIEDIRNMLAVDGYCIQHNNQSITFQFYVHPAPSYLRALDKAHGPHKEGHAATETIYRWILPGLGINYYLPKDSNKAARIQIYNRDEQYATVLKAYDKTWIHKMEQHRQYKPKYEGQQKPSQLTDEHIFTLEPSALAQRLKAIYKDDFGSAMKALTMFKNRMGKNLLSPDRDRIEKAKDQLRKLYGQNDDQNSGSKTPSGTEHSVPSGTTDDRKPIGSKPTTRTI